MLSFFSLEYSALFVQTLEETERRAPSFAFTDVGFFYPAGKIPEEAKALSLLAPVAPVPSLVPGGGLLPIPTPSPLQNVSPVCRGFL